MRVPLRCIRVGSTYINEESDHQTCKLAKADGASPRCFGIRSVREPTPAEEQEKQWHISATAFMRTNSFLLS